MKDIFVSTTHAVFQIRNKASNLCIDTRYKGSQERFELQKCVKDGGSGGEQVKSYKFFLHLY